MKCLSSDGVEYAELKGQAAKDFFEDYRLRIQNTLEQSTPSKSLPKAENMGIDGQGSRGHAIDFLQYQGCHLCSQSRAMERERFALNATVISIDWNPSLETSYYAFKLLNFLEDLWRWRVKA
jgi:hypothetical protein